MGAVKDLWNSEKGLVALVAFTLTIVGGITGALTWDQVLAMSKVTLYTYMGAKTATGIADRVTSRKADVSIDDVRGMVESINAEIDALVAAKFKKGEADAES